MASINSFVGKNVALNNLSVEGINSSEAVSEIPVEKIDEMPGNKEMFPYDQALMTQLEAEIKSNGFRDPIKVIRNENGRYVCVSGNQRLKVVRDMLGWAKIKCYILKDMSEQQIKDLWRSENIIHRKLTPLTYAKLASSYIDDYKTYKLHGGKVNYASQKLGVSQTHVKNYLLILTFPEHIQQLCNDTEFPYSVLISNTTKFTDEEKELLDKAILKWESDHSNQLLESSELKQLIRKVEKDYESQQTYDDSNAAEKYEIHSGDVSSEAKQLKDKNYKVFKQAIEDKLSAEKSDKPIIIDDDLKACAEAIYKIALSSRVCGNRMANENCIRLIKEAINVIDKDL